MLLYQILLILGMCAFLSSQPLTMAAVNSTSHKIIIHEESSQKENASDSTGNTSSKIRVFKDTPAQKRNNYSPHKVIQGLLSSVVNKSSHRDSKASESSKMKTNLVKNRARVSYKQKNKRNAGFYDPFSPDIWKLYYPTTNSQIFLGLQDYQPPSNNYYYYGQQNYPIVPIMPVPDSIYRDPAHELENLQNKLSLYPESFISDRNKLIKALKMNLEENVDEFNKLREKLQIMKDEPKGKINKIVSWIKLKRKENEMLNQDLVLLDELSSIITKLEVAKYVAYAKKAAESSSQPYDNLISSKSSIQQQYNQYDAHDSPNNVNRIYKPYEYFYNQPSDFSKKATIYKCNDNSNCTSKIVETEVSQPQTSERSMMSLEDTIKAIKAINYIQEKAGLDSKTIMKLITQLKTLSYNDMMNKKRSFQNNLYEFKRSSIGEPETQKNTEIYQKEKDFLEAQERYMFIKETEWIITKIEAAKYAALAKYKNKL